MISIETLTEFFGWCSVINIGVLMVAAFALVVIRKPIVKIHAKMFGLNESELSLLYIQYLGNYKIALIVLNLVPYIALKLMV